MAKHTTLHAVKLHAATALIAGLMLSGAAHAGPNHTPRADPLLEVVQCTTDSDCEQWDRLLRQARRECIAGTNPVACVLLHELHREACTMPNGDIDTSSDACLVHSMKASQPTKQRLNRK